MNDTIDYAALEPEYTDDKGALHILCACGHYVSGPKSGARIDLCPNCALLLRIRGSVPVERPDRLARGYWLKGAG